MIGLIGMSGSWEWVIILVVVFIIFGAGKLPKVLSQMGKGVKSFKDGMEHGDDDPADRQIDVTPDELPDEVPTQKVTEAEELKR